MFNPHASCREHRTPDCKPGWVFDAQAADGKLVLAEGDCRLSGCRGRPYGEGDRIGTPVQLICEPAGSWQQEMEFHPPLLPFL